MSPMVMLSDVKQSCEPFVCPGTYAPANTPTEKLFQMVKDAEKTVPEEDRRLIRDSLKWSGQKPLRAQDLPPEWDMYRKGKALNWMGLVSEIVARQNVRLYSPWTADLVCEECPGWLMPGSVRIGPGKRRPAPPGSNGEPGWEWKGVRAIQSRMPGREGMWILTCGMLRDRGAIKTKDECEGEKSAAQAQYDAQVERMIARVRKAAKRHMVNAMVYKVIADVVYAVCTVVFPVAAAMQPLHELHTRLATKVLMGEYGPGDDISAGEVAKAIAMTGAGTQGQQMDKARKIDLKDADDFFLKANDIIVEQLKQAPYVGPVVQIVDIVVKTSMAAYNVTRTMDKMKEEREDFRKKREELTAMNQALLEAIDARAAPDELARLNEEVAKSVADGQQMLAAERRKKLVKYGAMAALGVIALKAAGAL